MVKISVCILAKNEEKNIAACIGSVKNIADEIIVVDNGSMDQTKAIAESLDCRVLDGSGLLLDDARALYLNEARHDWILILDADERFQVSNGFNTKDYLSNIDENVWGLDVLSYQHLGEGKWSEIYILRFIRNHHNIHYNNTPIHSSMAPFILENNAKIENTNAFIIHHLDVLIQGRPLPKRMRYRNLLLDLLSQNNTDVDEHMINLYQCFLGLEYTAIEEYTKAEKIYLNVINQSFRYQNFAIQCLCELYIKTKAYDKVKKYMIPKNFELLKTSCVIGNYYYHSDKEKAIRYFEDMIDQFPYIPSNYLNLAYMLQTKDPIRAKYLLTKAIERNTYLTKEFVYKEGEKPNIFDVQSNILAEIDNVYTLLKALHMESMVCDKGNEQI